MVFLLWDYLPEQTPDRASGRGVDRSGSREDFAALVIMLTLLFGLVFYIATQAISSFSPMSEKELEKAYLGGAVGAAIIGFMTLVAGWLAAG